MNLAGKFRQLVEQQPFDQFQTTRDRETAKWISQHGGAAIALVGDSIAFGISSQLNQGVEADAAVGLTSTAVLGRVKSNVKLKNATTAVISVGSNDIVGGKGNAAMLTANAQKIRNELNAKQYIWIVPYDSVAADAIDKAKGTGDQLIALKDFKTNDGVHPGSYTAVANAIRTITKKSAPATPSNVTPPADGGGDGKRNSEDPRRSDAPAGTGSAAQPEDLETLQKALIAAGFDLPKYGADGKMGPETKQAILRAEQKLGRSPTGSITTQELAKLSGTDTTTPTPSAKPMDADKLAKLTQSIANMEQALSRIKKESIQRDPVSEMAQWRNIVEADGIYVPPNTGGSARDAGTQARMQMARNPNPAIARSNNPFGLTPSGAAPTASTTPTTGRLKRLSQNLAKRVVGAGGGAAGAAKTAGKLGLRAIPYLTVPMLAYDLYGAWRDTVEEEELALDDEVRKVVERELETIMTIADDPEAMGTIPKELRDRIEKIKQQLENRQTQ
jgi:peptidoglycan hydrolase-like protein with peptidoglycan-binding domain